MDEHFAWMTTRQISRTLAGFERAWRPDTHPGGMLRAYAYWSEDKRQSSGCRFGLKAVVRSVAGLRSRGD